MPANLENSAVATGLEKVCFHSNAKERSNYHTIALISHTSKVKLKILQARLQRYMNSELPDVQAGYTKGRGTRDNCQHPLDHRKSNTVPEKNIYFWVIDYAKDLDCVDHILLCLSALKLLWQNWVITTKPMIFKTYTFYYLLLYSKILVKHSYDINSFKLPFLSKILQSFIKLLNSAWPCIVS